MAEMSSPTRLEDLDTGAAGTPTMLEKSVVATVRGVNEVENAVIGIAQSVLEGVIRAAGSVAMEGVNVSRDILKGTFSALEEVSLGAVVTVSALAKGLVGGLSALGGSTWSVADRAVHVTIRGAAEVGSELGGMTATAVNFGLKTTRDICLQVEEAAKAVSTGTLDVATLAACTAIQATRDLLVATVLGGKEMVCAVIPRPKPSDVEVRNARALSIVQELAVPELRVGTAEMPIVPVEAEPAMAERAAPPGEVQPAPEAGEEAATITEESPKTPLPASRDSHSARSTESRKTGSRGKRVHHKEQRSEAPEGE